MSDSNAVAYRYDGSAKYFNLPARDITEKDLARFSPSQLRELRFAAAYKPVKQPSPAKEEEKRTAKEGE